MSKLRSLQRSFQQYILDENPDMDMHHFIVDDIKVGAVKRLSIYHEAYRLRLIEALSSAYPKLHVLLGEELFRKTARGYIQAYPSYTRNLRWYGDAMAAYLANALPHHPIASEIAMFEWTLALAFDALDTRLVTIQDMAQVALEDWTRLQFSFHPSIYMILLEWNTIEVWKMLDAELDPPAIQKQLQAVNWLIWRKELSPYFRSIDQQELAVLQLAMNGNDFSEICAFLNDELGEEASSVQAAQYLASWINDELVIEYT